jgi:aminopeptidase N
VISTTVNGTIVNSYYLPEDEAGGERVLRYASDSLRIYNELFGRYPFSELDVVETPTKAGGIEYPGLIVVADRFYERERGFFELVAAHEVAHQWWYSLVGSDQVDEPWLDEALTNYSTVFYYESVYGKEEGESFIKNYFEEAYRKVVEEGRDMAVAQPVAAFSREDYGPIVYGKGPLFFHSLRGEVGDKVYLAIMQEYLRRHKYGIATPESFLEVAEEVSKRELDSLYEEWLLSPRRSGG